MDDREAASVLSTVRSREIRPPLTLMPATIIVETWLRAKGYQATRAEGGFARPGDTENRALARGRTLRWQKRNTYSRDWFTTEDKPMIDAALNLVVNAAKHANDQEMLDMFMSGRASRKGAKQKAKVRKEKKAYTGQATNVAAYRIAEEYPGFYLANALGVTVPQDLYDSVRAKGHEYITIAEGDMALGTDPVVLEHKYYSVDAPPLPPLVHDSKASLVVEEEGVDYSVFISQRKGSSMYEDGVIAGARVLIGEGSDVLTFDPDSLRPIPLYQVEDSVTKSQGDGLLAGLILLIKTEGGKVMCVGEVYMVAAKESDNFLEVGRRLMSIWCRLLTGYGGMGFFLRAPLEDEQEMLRTLAMSMALRERSGENTFDCGIGSEYEAKVRAALLYEYLNTGQESV